MPTLRRSSSNSSSFRLGTLLPATRTSPLSGYSRPTTCRSKTLLPVPDGPMTTEIFPAGIWQVTPSSTWLPSNPLWRSSTSTMYSPFLLDAGGSKLPNMLVPLRGDRKIGIYAPEDLGEDGVDDHDHHQAVRHGFGHGPADADGAAFDVVAVIDADADHEEGEDDGLDHRVAEVRQVGEAPEIREVHPVGDQSDLKALHDPAGEEAGRQGEDVHQGQNQQAGDHAGRDQEGNGRHAHRFQRIDLLVDPHGPKLGYQAAAHFGADGKAEEQRGDLAKIAERVEDAGVGFGSAELVQRVIGLHRTLRAAEVGHRQRHRRRADGEKGRVPSDFFVVSQRPRHGAERADGKEDDLAEDIEEVEARRPETARHGTELLGGRPNGGGGHQRSTFWLWKRARTVGV